MNARAVCSAERVFGVWRGLCGCVLVFVIWTPAGRVFGCVRMLGVFSGLCCGVRQYSAIQQLVECSAERAFGGVRQVSKTSGSPKIWSAGIWTTGAKVSKNHRKLRGMLRVSNFERVANLARSRNSPHFFATLSRVS